MRGISITLILTSLLIFTFGCGESSKRVNAADNSIAEKKASVPAGDSKGLFQGTVLFAWDVITLGYDKKRPSGQMQKGLTLRQAQNAGFMNFIASLTDGSGPYRGYGGSHFSGGPGMYRDRGYDYGFGYGFGFGHGCGYRP